LMIVEARAVPGPPAKEAGSTPGPRTIQYQS
jgi:hypothetical protein